MSEFGVHDDYWREQMMKANVKHGLYNTKLYHVFIGMKQRCFNQNNPSYPRYGGRGITICEEWLGDKGFNNFYKWSMENGYKEGLSIDRIDNDGNYEPSNCRWADNYTQLNNYSRNKNITFNGETHSLSVWGRIKPNGLGYETLRNRLRSGWDVDRAFTEPYHPNELREDRGNMITINGETHNVKYWCEINGICRSTFYRRIKRGFDIESALTK